MLLCLSRSHVVAEWETFYANENLFNFPSRWLIRNDDDAASWADGRKVSSRRGQFGCFWLALTSFLIAFQELSKLISIANWKSQKHGNRVIETRNKLRSSLKCCRNLPQKTFPFSSMHFFLLSRWSCKAHFLVLLKVACFPWSNSMFSQSMSICSHFFSLSWFKNFHIRRLSQPHCCSILPCSLCRYVYGVSGCVSKSERRGVWWVESFLLNF